MGVEIHKRIISPALDTLTHLSGGRIGSELQHHAVRETLHYMEYLPSALDALRLLTYSNPRLATSVAGIEMNGPIGVAAGWDKKGRAVRALHAAGFSHVEEGSVLVYDQPGNPSTRENPRQRVAKGKVALNSLGFNAPGVVVNAHNSEKYKDDPNIVLGISIGKNKTVADNFAAAAHYMVAKRMWRQADYLVINVSSPNTPGLRALQDKGPLTDILQAVKQGVNEEKRLYLEETQLVRDVPVLIKLAPDLTDSATSDAVHVVIDNGGNGFIDSNTTNNQDIKTKYGWRDLPGGLSGDDPDYRRLVDHQVEFTYKESGGMPIISAGAINTPEQALRRVELGAAALQVNAGLRADGLFTASKLNRGIIELMDRKGYKTLAEAVGAAVK